MAKRVESLEVEDLPSFQRKEWRIQRIGWVAWALVLLAGMLGLIGSGPLSSTSSSATDESLTVRYDRFLHYHQPTTFEVTLHPGVIYTFPKAASVESAIIRLHVQYEAIGNSSGRIALLGHEPAAFNQFVYP